MQQPRRECVDGPEAVVDLAAGRVARGGQPIWLTPAEWALLAHLLRAGRTVARAELLAALCGAGADPLSNAVAVHVSRLRRKLGAAAIATERGGYRAAVAAIRPT